MPSVSTDGTASVPSEPWQIQQSVIWFTLTKYSVVKFIRIYNYFVYTKPFNGYFKFWLCLRQAINSWCNIAEAIEVMNWCN